MTTQEFRGQGEVVAVGTNEIPQAGGGVYSALENVGELDDRDFTNGEDTSDRFKRNNLAEVLMLIRETGCLTEEMTVKGTTELLDASLPSCGRLGS